MKRLRSPEHPAGIGGVLEVIIVLIALAVIGLAVWLAFGHKKGVKVGPVSVGKTLNATCDYHDPNLCKFVNNFQTIKNYQVTASGTDSNGTKSTSVFKLDGSDKFQLTTSTGSKEVFNEITIGNTVYTKDYSDGKWWKQNNSSDQSSTKKDFEFNSNSDVFAPTKTTYKFIAKEPCVQNLMCFKYQVTDVGGAQDSTQYIWFDDKDYDLRKITVQTTGGPVQELDYNYGKVSISAPSPTKDLAPGQFPAGSLNGAAGASGSVNVTPADNGSSE